jgi:hypothetical protein
LAAALRIPPVVATLPSGLWRRGEDREKEIERRGEKEERREEKEIERRERGEKF